MSLRRRLTVAGGGAVFVALAIASLVIYFSVRSNLHEQIDASLIQSAQDVASKWNVANTLQSAKVPPGKGASGRQVPRARLPAATAGPLFGSDGSGYFQVIPNLGTATKRELSAQSAGKSPLKQSLDGFVPGDRPGRVGGEGTGAAVLPGRSLPRRGDGGCTRCRSRPRATGWCGPHAR